MATKQTRAVVAPRTRRAISKPPVPLAYQVCELLRASIITGEIPAGQYLSEVRLGEQFGASRTPIREACIRLEQEGLLRVTPYKGYVVTAVSVDEVQELYQLREIVEPAGAELAARRDLGPDFFAACEQLLEKAQLILDNQRNYEGFKEQVATESELHFAIARASGNRKLERIVSELMAQIRRFLYFCYSQAVWLDSVIDEHRAIIEALRLHDGSQARKLMEEHLALGTQRASQIIIRSSFPERGEHPGEARAR